ncbi:cytochrome c maturation protein CcmE [Solirhodobacter olei]|uniref:cytochrome c maturation protein CcmE n=1 Tax=Solirhodobacter olei TaxID=2493082 RepID=UPI000FDA0890|nr:cytochrome c maturation protein CcmE [Solirhodobacter olei]
MKGLKKKRRVQIIVVAAVSLAVSTAMIGYALRGGINYFRTPSQILSEHISPREVFRVGGLVKAGSIKPTDGVDFTFVVTDGKKEIPVDYVGASAKPDLFEGGKGTVATGTWNGKVFRATQILAKHDANYMPREVLDALKKDGMYVKPGSS